jgi:hypothetical protein
MCRGYPSWHWVNAAMIFRLKERVIIRFLNNFEQIKVEQNPYYPFSPRFYYKIVVRGQENNGPQWFPAPYWLHKVILNGLDTYKILPKLTKRQKIYRFLANHCFLFCVKKWLADKIPICDCFDPYVGYDFILEKRKDRFVGEFIPVSCPAGTQEQLKQWDKPLDFPKLVPESN